MTIPANGHLMMGGNLNLELVNSQTSQISLGSQLTQTLLGNNEQTSNIKFSDFYNKNIPFLSYDSTSKTYNDSQNFAVTNVTNVTSGMDISYTGNYFFLMQR